MTSGNVWQKEIKVIYIVSLTVFSIVIFSLVGMLLVVEAKIVEKGELEIEINGDTDNKIAAPSGSTLLSALVSEGILLPSACGGGGSCGMCKCEINEGGGGVLPTELAHLSRSEKNKNVRVACQVKVKENMSIRIPDEIFSIKKYTATVESNENVATFIKELILRLDPGDPLEFDAGAYIQLEIPEYKLTYDEFTVEEEYREAWDAFKLWSIKANSDEPAIRAYSLANPPYEQDILKFTIRIATPPLNALHLPAGIGSSYLFKLKPGDKIDLSGPYGDFFVKETDREMCFIGGGAGMAPMRCHIFHQLRTVNTNRKMTFWYGARSKQEMFYDDDFDKLQEEFPNFSYKVALSEPLETDKWEGLEGYIHTCLYETYLKDHPDPTEIEYYLCGPPMMIDAVVATLDDLGVDPEMILYDKF